MQNNNTENDQQKPQKPERSYGHLRLLGWLLELAAFACVAGSISIFVVNALVDLTQLHLILALCLIIGAIVLHMLGDAIRLLIKTYKRQIQIEYLLRREIQREKTEWQKYANTTSQPDEREHTHMMLLENDRVLAQLEQRKRTLENRRR